MPWNISASKLATLCSGWRFWTWGEWTEWATCRRSTWHQDWNNVDNVVFLTALHLFTKVKLEKQKLHNLLHFSLEPKTMFDGSERSLQWSGRIICRVCDASKYYESNWLAWLTALIYSSKRIFFFFFCTDVWGKTGVGITQPSQNLAPGHRIDTPVG